MSKGWTTNVPSDDELRRIIGDLGGNVPPPSSGGGNNNQPNPHYFGYFPHL